MTKGEQSRQRLIDCAAELFWKNGYAATGISEILNASGLPKGSFYFYFKSKEELAVAVVSYYQAALLDKMRVFAANRTWEEFVKDVFAYLENLSAGSALRGCPFAVMGMELAFQRPEIAKSYLNGLTQFQALFRGVLLQSGLSQPHADVLSGRLIAVYQGNLLLGRISQERGYLGCAKESMLQMYKEYRAVYGIASSEE